MCKLICILATPGSADGLCGSADPVVLVCSGVWGLFSLIGVVAYCRWQGDRLSAGDESTAELPELVRRP